MKRLITGCVALALLAVFLALPSPVAAQVTPIQPDTVGRFVAAGPLPTLGTCGTSSTMVGNDTAGKITIGTGTPATCAFTFSRAFAAAPSCTAEDETTTSKVVNATSTTTAVTIAVTGNTVNGDVLSYVCIGR